MLIRPAARRRWRPFMRGPELTVTTARGDWFGALYYSSARKAGGQARPADRADYWRAGAVLGPVRTSRHRRYQDPFPPRAGGISRAFVRDSPRLAGDLPRP